MSTASDNVHPLGHALLTGHPTGKRYDPPGDVEVGCTGCTSSRGTGTPWKFALVALIQVVAWIWILVTFVPMGNFGGRPSGSAPLLLEGYDGSVVMLSDPSSYHSYSGSAGRRPAVNLWSDERHLINVQLGTDGASGTTIITGLGIRYADGTRIVLAEHELTPGSLRVAVDGQEYTGDGYLVQALTHEGDGIRLQYDTAPARAGAEGPQPQLQPQQRAVIITDEGLRVEVSAAGGSRSGEQQQRGLRVTVSVDPGSAAQQLSGKGPGGVEGLLGRTLRGAQQTAAATAGSQQQQHQQQQEQQAWPDASALYLVPHLLSEHPATNRFIAHRTPVDQGSL